MTRSLTRSRRPKVIIVGLDSAPFGLVTQWGQEGRLPTISRLLREGASATLLSTVPPITPPAWTTFLTGVNPGKHGIYGFTHPAQDYGLTYTTGAWRRTKALWDYTGEAGLFTALFNVPWTFPPEPIHGVMVSGMDSPAFDRRIASPPAVFADLARLVGSYRMNVTYEDSRYPLEIRAEIDKRYIVSRHLLSDYPVDVFMVVFNETDHVQHLFWGQDRLVAPDGQMIANVIFQVYEHIDRHLGTLLTDFADENTLVLVVSDHGAGPLRRHINLRRLCLERGWLRLRTDVVPASARRALHSGEAPQPRDGTSGFSAMPWIASQLRRLPAAHRRSLLRLLPAGVAHHLTTHYSRIDWTHSTAFPGSCGAFYLNRKGRYRDGWISNGAEYERIRDDLIHGLMDMRDENGEKVMRAVYRAEELYSGDHLDLAPDLMAVPADHGDDLQGGSTEGPVFSDVTQGRADSRVLLTGTHRPEGVLLMCGKDVHPGLDLGEVHLMDILPTILHRLSLPIPNGMDGTPLTHAFSSASSSNVSRARGTAKDLKPPISPYSPEDAARVEARLRDLGYL